MLAESNNAKAVVAIADAQAEVKRAMGKAEADVILARGEAEASVLETKAEAYQEFGEAAMVEVVISKLPEIARNVVAPLNETGKISFVSGQGESGGGVGGLMQSLSAIPEAVQGATGLDLREAAKRFAGQQQERRAAAAQGAR